MNQSLATLPPKVFISYSHDFQDKVKEYADRLISEGGIDAKIDIYDLEKGHDLNKYMEEMVNNPEIQFVLMFCTKAYTKKANARKGGVGTESAIISQEVYGNAQQKKFIPIACEVDEEGNFTLPTFVKSRNSFDFTTPEKTYEEWENLIRFLHNKPRYQKPKIGTPPSYILHDDAKEYPGIRHQFETYKHAVHQGKVDTNVLRNQFFTACEEEIDELRVREEPNTLTLAYEIVEKYTNLKKLRNIIIEWLMFESNLIESDFTECFIDFLEHILIFKIKPTEMRMWNDSWFDSHRLFLHDLFVYSIAALVKNKRYDELKKLTEHKFLFPEGYGRYDLYFGDFVVFYGTSGVIKKEIKISEERHYISPTAELFKRNADIKTLPFSPNFMETELLLFIISVLKTQSTWFPWSLLYAGYGCHPFPLFLRATKREGFDILWKILGIDSANSLREAYKEKIEQTGMHSSFDYHDLIRQVWSCANMDQLDTL